MLAHPLAEVESSAGSRKWTALITGSHPATPHPRPLLPNPEKCLHMCRGGVSPHLENSRRVTLSFSPAELHFPLLSAQDRGKENSVLPKRIHPWVLVNQSRQERCEREKQRASAFSSGGCWGQAWDLVAGIGTPGPRGQCQLGWEARQCPGLQDVTAFPSWGSDHGSVAFWLGDL